MSGRSIGFAVLGSVLLAAAAACGGDAKSSAQDLCVKYDECKLLGTKFYSEGSTGTDVASCQKASNDYKDKSAKECKNWSTMETSINDMSDCMAGLSCDQLAAWKDASWEDIGSKCANSTDPVCNCINKDMDKMVCQT